MSLQITNRSIYDKERERRVLEEFVYVLTLGNAVWSWGSGGELFRQRTGIEKVGRSSYGVAEPLKPSELFTV